MAIRAPLRVHKGNPRYLTDDDVRVVYVTGSHTWSDLQDMGGSDPPQAFDHDAYLTFLKAHNHNFIRLWRWEVPRWRYAQGKISFCEPHPWLRTGPGLARDGKRKFDLRRFNDAYFQRLIDRVQAANRQNLYVSVMLFEGHCLQFAQESWEFHPFHPDNNVNGVDAGRLNYYTLQNATVLELQEAYVRRVVDTVNDLNNVLYEICNEAGNYSTEWQYHWIRFVKRYEAQKRKQHLVGMTFQYGAERSARNADLFNSPADWISPNPDGGYRDDPPVNDGRKVVLNDTDHLWGEGGNPQWVWKTFTRGHHPLFMDRIAELSRKNVVWAGQEGDDIPGSDGIRKAMGVTRKLALQVNLAEMHPLPEPASSKYCLSTPGKAYIVYLPEGGEVTVDLSQVKGTLRARWMHPTEGRLTRAQRVTGGAKVTLRSPMEGHAVLWLSER